MDHAYIVGVDVGTSSTKTALWRADGVLMAEAVEEYPLHRPCPSWAEMNAMDWWNAACQTIQRVLVQSGINKDDIAGVGVDGLGWALVPVNAAGEPLYPAMIWLDRRAEAEAAWLRALPEADELVDLVANPLDAAYITPKILWLKKYEPAVFSATHKFLTSSGFIVQRLTDEFSCDYTQAYGYHFFDIRHERWDEGAADLMNIPLSKMPPLYQSCQLVGRVTSCAALATGLAPGTPVIVGGLDASIGSFGAGVARLGQTVDQGGQAGGIALSVDQVIVEPRLIFSHHVVPGQYLFQAGTVGGGSLGWFRDTLGQWESNAAKLVKRSVYSLMSTEVEDTPPGAHGLIFLPYMAGERSPIWNSEARGVFFGLSYKTTRADILRALMEGCAFAVYHNVRVAEEKKARIQEWIGIGGAARSDVWCQIKADVTNRPFTLARRPDGGEGGHTLGLAVMVAQAVGLCDDMVACIEKFLPERRVFQPSPERHAMYEDLFQLYLTLSDNLQPHFKQLANIIELHPQFLAPEC
jgi:xylulokinase